MNTIPRFSTYFRLDICGEITPEKITEIIGIQPTRIWYAGEEIRKTNKKAETSGWQYDTAKIECWHADEVITTLLGMIEKSKKQIIDLTNKKLVESRIGVVCFFERAPSAYLSRELVKRIAELNAELDIDLYAV